MRASSLLRAHIETREVDTNDLRTYFMPDHSVGSKKKYVALSLHAINCCLCLPRAPSLQKHHDEIMQLRFTVKSFKKKECSYVIKNKNLSGEHATEDGLDLRVSTLSRGRSRTCEESREKKNDATSSLGSSLCAHCVSFGVEGHNGTDM